MMMKFLKAVVSLPYCTPEGRVVTRPGYDEETQLFLDLPRDWTPRVPSNPTSDQVRKAVMTLVGPWSAYGIATPDDAAGMVSAVLTAVSRPMMDIAPAYLFDACQQGSGKTKAALALGSLIEGERVGVVPYSGASDDEMRKRLVAGAMEGTKFICLDNVTGYMKSEAMTAVLTSGKLSDRVLGQSRTVNPTIRALMTMTGNNASLSADLMRRTVAVRIDAGSSPTHRVFGFDPVMAALAQRQQIAEAACVIWRWFFAAGAPAAGGGTGGFDAWSKIARDPVVLLASSGLADGLPWVLGDPAASMLRDPADADPELESVGDMLHALHVLSEGADFKAAEMARWLRLGQTAHDEDSPVAVLRDSVAAIRRKTDEVTVSTAAMLLRNKRDRVLKGFKLMQNGNSLGGRSSMWRVVRA